MKSTSFGSSEVRSPARSPGLSSTGPLVSLNPTPSSLAMMFDNVVFPSPGGPCRRVWSRGSPRIRAASTKTFRFSTTFFCPVKSEKESGRSAFSKSRSDVAGLFCVLRMSKLSCILCLVVCRGMCVVCSGGSGRVAADAVSGLEKVFCQPCKGMQKNGIRQMSDSVLYDFHYIVPAVMSLPLRM